VSGARRLWPPIAAPLVLATLFFGRQIASWGSETNRFLFFWQRRDAVLLIAGVLILAAVLYAAGMTLARWKWSRDRRLHELALVVVLVAAGLAQINALSSKPLRGVLLWMAVGALLAWAWRRWPDRLLTIARGACLVLSPLPPILFLQMLLWHPLHLDPQSARPTPPAISGRPPVLIAVFDEWSWFRAAPDGRPAPQFTNLNWLADRSMLVREARSSGPATRYSLPRFIYQRQGEIKAGNGFARWVEQDSAWLSTEVPDMFDRVRERGYRSVLFGFYIPYRALLGADGADRIVSLPSRYKGKTWPGELGLMLMDNVQHLTDPVSETLWPTIQAAAYRDNWLFLNQMLRDSTLEALRKEPDNTLIFAHLPLPHAPFIFNDDGTYRGTFGPDRLVVDSTGYERQLRYADAVLGELIKALQDAGRFDQALVVITSDHTWREEKDSTILAHADAPLRVPLLIKWPGQQRPMVSDQPFCLRALEPVIQAAIASPTPPELTDSLWQVIAESARITKCAT
jgi:hypothetical protein